MEIVSEIPLKLTRKCVDVFGMDSLESESERRTVCKHNCCNLTLVSLLISTQYALEFHYKTWGAE